MEEEEEVRRRWGRCKKRRRRSPSGDEYSAADWFSPPLPLSSVCHSPACLATLMMKSKLELFPELSYSC